MDLGRSESSLSCTRPPSSLLVERPVESDEPVNAQEKGKRIHFFDVFCPSSPAVSPALPRAIVQNEEKRFESAAVFSPSPEAGPSTSPKNVVQNKEKHFELPDVFSPTPENVPLILPRAIVQNDQTHLNLPEVFSPTPDTVSPARATTDHHLPSSSSHQASSIEVISTPADLRNFKSGELERQGAPAREVLRDQFAGPRPVGDPSVLVAGEYRLMFPPPSRDAYPNIERFPFLFVESSKPVDLDEPIGRYVEQSDKLEDFLTAQSKKYTKDYIKYARQHAKLTATWDKINDARYAKAEKESRRQDHNPAKGEHKIIEPLTRNQQRKVIELETDLAPLMEKVALNRAETEGAIAAAFMFNWDYADRAPTKHQISILCELKGFEKFVFEKERPEVKTGLDYVVTDTDLHGHAMSRNPTQPLFDDIRKESKKVYQEAFWKQRKEDLLHAPVTSLPLPPPPEPVESVEAAPWEAFLCPKPKTTVNDEAKLSTPIPDWFAIFVKSNIFKFESLKLQDKFNELLRAIRKLESRVNNPDTPARPKWDLEWHDPSLAWSTPVRQKSGG
ncbi:hypothetical protein NCS57_00259800 [Fusarium keratoplasticum]|uniref:Uncharacterized protein n=1 Tax=Fusarium keratoplasticum TaxID=1328300 RepID=A0ACC0R968_9HYPO|nr:hypothetical protein NCS57_00259800 [Fusarium keratoplasticum]KAI8679810.1 hypothetical protein NCS57_00259800 [Fusarium keratoplasticum]KAI8685897.1 hypothetical protein NCS55_00263400 [Fusarium keratoplasticum]